MSTNTSIPWAHHTFNPWWGCGKGCPYCYAQAWAKRVGSGCYWGKDAPRRMFGPGHWHEPVEWNVDAELAGERRRVFCGSMCDVMEDHPDVAAARVRLFDLIESTYWLDWLLLTKNPENYSRFLPGDWLQRPRRQVWLGATGETQEAAERAWSWLADIPARVRFICHEPGLGELRLFALARNKASGNGRALPDWIITGGQSGPNAERYDLAWPRRLVLDGREARVKIYVKQVGAVLARELGLRDLKGEDPAEWPEGLRVREFPEAV